MSSGPGYGPPPGYGPGPGRGASYPFTAPPWTPIPPIPTPTTPGPLDAIKAVFAKYATFDGRASRREFWWWFAFCAIIDATLMVLTIVGSFTWLATGLSSAPSTAGLAYILVPLALLAAFGLVVLVPSIAVAVRRLHDIGYSGLVALAWFLPAGAIIVLVLCAQRPVPYDNAYGLAERPESGPEL